MLPFLEFIELIRTIGLYFSSDLENFNNSSNIFLSSFCDFSYTNGSVLDIIPQVTKIIFNFFPFVLSMDSCCL